MARIIIIGGGIGGLTAAACLRARGIESNIYERATEMREVGAALALWPNATRILKRLAVLEGLLARAHTPPVGALRDAKGKVLLRMAALQSDVPSVFAHRADVHSALMTAIPAASMHLDKQCAGVERDGERIRALFSDGTMSNWADGLIGADGIRSVVREQTLHDGPPIYRGYVAWRGVANFEPGEEIVGESWGCGKRFGFIPLGRGRVGWWATANKPGNEGERTCARAPAQWKEELLKEFARWHAPIPALLAATPESAFLCNAIMDRPPLPPHWGDGLVTLLGDAAHPTTPNLGQGACMAIEDAAVVALALAAIPEIPTAFRVYENTRLERTSWIVRESLKFGKIGQWENRLACELRNRLVQVAPRRRMRRQFRNLWLYDAWDTPLVMRG